MGDQETGAVSLMTVDIKSDFWSLPTLWFYQDKDSDLYQQLSNILLPVFAVHLNQYIGPSSDILMLT